MALADLLKSDGALTLNQARRWVSGALPEPDRVLHVYGLEVPVFLSPELADADDGLVMHAAMVGEMRRILEVPATAWRAANATRTDHTGLEPDAVWNSKRGRIAVEFDAGRYPRDRVTAKLKHYDLAYDGQIWGVLRPARIGYVQRLARELGLKRPPTITVEP
ncbi:hypothetical protein Ocepr_2350 (plasmid) [Oceanithermus profundus DSM 14977]|uniref:Uncharacterized protein n=1 Tax=Oceanithermus profundus (strain DSM 14977 / NBRC 100410 / VKM B-2274 / 506) TaxID=670487 RepID=E4UAL9_OCEP5|nr:replication-relaxation family protein [Oceanithermus profundus]ADR37798.1 hypothetical protein Ocepr_2350 [Oceanithermus profundus DSM 14977]